MVTGAAQALWLCHGAAHHASGRGVMLVGAWGGVKIVDGDRAALLLHLLPPSTCILASVVLPPQPPPPPHPHTRTLPQCSDIDGTMVGDDDRADERTREFTEYWENNASLGGSVLVYNTGR